MKKILLFIIFLSITVLAQDVRFKASGDTVYIYVKNGSKSIKLIPGSNSITGIPYDTTYISSRIDSIPGKINDSLDTGIRPDINSLDARIKADSSNKTDSVSNLYVRFIADSSSKGDSILNIYTRFIADSVAKNDSLATKTDSNKVETIITPHLLSPTQYPAFLYVDPDSNMMYLSKTALLDSSGANAALATKLPKNFTTLTKYEGTNDADMIPVMDEGGDGTTKYMETAKLAVSDATEAEFASTLEDISHTYATQITVDANGNALSQLQTQVNTLSNKVDSLCRVVETLGNPFPTCPTDVAGTGYETTIRLTWTNSSDPFDSTAVYYGVLNADNWTIKWVSKDSAATTLTGLTASTAYNIYLKHRNGTVYSDASTMITVVTSTSGGAGDLADYYVNYDGGDDANDGLSEATAWKHSPGDPLATGVPLSKNLVAGDTVLFKGGVSYLGQVLIDGDGTGVDSIVFLGGKGWGTGRAVFDMENTRQYAFKGGRDYIKIQGFNFYNYSVAGSDYVLYPSTGASYWNIDSCTFAFLQGWNTGFPSKDVMLLSNSITNITIQNCEFFANGQTAIHIRYASNINIWDNNFGGINRGDSTGYISVAIRGEVGSNLIDISDNTFHDCWQYGGNVYPEYNHAPSMIHVYGTADGVYNAATDPHDYTIQRNYFYNNLLIYQGTGTSDIQLTTDCRRMTVRNNLVVNSTTHNIGNINIASGADSIGVYNNTFIMRDFSGTVSGEIADNIVIYTNTTQTVGDSIWIENNVFYNDNNMTLAYNVRLTGAVNTFNGVIDYNAYYNPDTLSFGANPGAYGITSWKSNGYDAHSNFYTTGTTFFTTLPATGATSSSGDYTLSDSAPAFLKTGGKTLTDVTDDYNRTARTEPWSVGCFEK